MRISWHRRTHLLVVGIFLMAGCADLFGPDPLVRPQLRALLIDDLGTSLRHGGILYLNGYPADTAFRLETGQRVPAAISVSSGDNEDVGLYRRSCPARDRGPGFECFDFSVTMRDGFHAADLLDHVTAMNGRFQVISISGRFGGITLFDPGGLVRRARDARSWPGVAYTSLSYASCAPDAPACLSRSDLRLPVPVDTGTAIGGDGIVQVRSGDTVVVVYEQAAGILEARRVVP